MTTNQLLLIIIVLVVFIISLLIYNDRRFKKAYKLIENQDDIGIFLISELQKQYDYMHRTLVYSDKQYNKKINDLTIYLNCLESGKDDYKKITDEVAHG